MTERNTQVITSRQARKQIDHFGRSLIVYISVFMLFRYGTQFLYSMIPSLAEDIDPTILLLAGQSILLILVALIPFTISSNALHLDIHDYLKRKRIKPGRMFSIICIGIGINLITTGFASLFSFFTRTNTTTYVFLGNFTTFDSILENVLYFILYVLVTPICDEYIFRGIVQRQLGHYGRYFGVLGSAMLFAISRANLVDAIPAFFVGWYLSLITLKYHSIRPAFAVHISLSAFLWMLNIASADLLMFVTILIVLVYIISALSIFQKRVSTNLVRYGATEPKLWKILFTSPSILVCMALFVINVVISML